MTLLARLTGLVRQIKCALLQQLLQQLASVFEQCLAKPQFDCFQIANAQAFPLLTDQIQEGSRFSKLFLDDLRGLEFFLASDGPSSQRVIWSVIWTNCSANCWKR